MKDHIILGPYFDATDKVFSTIIPNKKQKQELVDMLEKTLQEMAPFCFKMNINTKMGFNIGILQKYIFTYI